MQSRCFLFLLILWRNVLSGIFILSENLARLSIIHAVVGVGGGGVDECIVCYWRTISSFLLKWGVLRITMRGVVHLSFPSYLSLF